MGPAACDDEARGLQRAGAEGGESSRKGRRGKHADAEELKRTLKRWERTFEETQGRKPERDDVRADPAIHALYKKYGVLKQKVKAADSAKRGPNLNDNEQCGEVQRPGSSKVETGSSKRSKENPRTHGQEHLQRKDADRKGSKALKELPENVDPKESNRASKQRTRRALNLDAQEPQGHGAARSEQGPEGLEAWMGLVGIFGCMQPSSLACVPFSAVRHSSSTVDRPLQPAEGKPAQKASAGWMVGQPERSNELMAEQSQPTTRLTSTPSDDPHRGTESGRMASVPRPSECPTVGQGPAGTVESVGMTAKPQPMQVPLMEGGGCGTGEPSNSASWHQHAAKVAEIDRPKRKRKSTAGRSEPREKTQRKGSSQSAYATEVFPATAEPTGAADPSVGPAYVRRSTRLHRAGVADARRNGGEIACSGSEASAADSGDDSFSAGGTESQDSERERVRKGRTQRTESSGKQTRKGAEADKGKGVRAKAAPGGAPGGAAEHGACAEGLTAEAEQHRPGVDAAANDATPGSAWKAGPAAAAGWANSKALRNMEREYKAQQRKSKRAGAGAAGARRRQAVVGRDNFVKINMKRKFVNGTRSKGSKGGKWRGGGGNWGSRKRWSKKGGQVGGANASSNPGGACIDAEAMGATGLAADEPMDAAGVESEAAVRLKESCALAAADPSEENILAVMEQAFGFRGFRPGQLDAIQRVLRRKSTLLLLPTGGGKSLCYQLPALLLSGLVLVVSPLVALMQDQLQRLPCCLPGALLSSAQSALDAEDTIGRLRAGKVKVLFVSPERLAGDAFLRLLSSLPMPVSLVAVDEAHCVAEWSHNFRPSYLRIGALVRERLGAPPVLALTATSTRRTESSLLRALAIPPDGVVRQVPVRRNLTLTASRCQDRTKALLALLRSPALARVKSIIVYCSFQWEADDVARQLRDSRISARSYHSGLPSDQRTRIFHQFCNNKIKVVVATVAFGMGLDKADVGAVVHHGMPKSIEQYVQEVGRAGRDGRPAVCHLLLHHSNFLKLHSLAHSDGVDEAAVRKCLRLIFHESVAAKGSSAAQSSAAADGNAAARPACSMGWRSFAKDKVARELDIKPEVLATMFAFWEAEALQGDEPLLQVLPEMRSTCSLSFHRSQPQALAAQHPLIASILMHSAQRNGRYTFDLCAVASDVQMAPPDLFRHMLALQRAGELSCEFTDEALCIQMRTGIPPPSDDFLQSLAHATWQRLQEVEQCGVGKVETMFRLASAAIARDSQGSKDPATGARQEGQPNAADGHAGHEEDSAAEGEGSGAEDGGRWGDGQSGLIQRRIVEYFESQDGMIQWGAEPPPLPHKTDSRFLRTDVKVFLHSNKDRLGIASGRAVARILHGISSPAYPYSDWSRHHFWARYMDVPFSQVLSIANEEVKIALGLRKT